MKAYKRKWTEGERVNEKKPLQYDERGCFVHAGSFRRAHRKKSTVFQIPIEKNTLSWYNKKRNMNFCSQTASHPPKKRKRRTTK